MRWCTGLVTRGREPARGTTVLTSKNSVAFPCCRNRYARGNVVTRENARSSVPPAGPVQHGNARPPARMACLCWSTVYGRCRHEARDRCDWAAMLVRAVMACYAERRVRLPKGTSRLSRRAPTTSRRPQPKPGAWVRRRSLLSRAGWASWSPRALRGRCHPSQRSAGEESRSSRSPSPSPAG